MPTGILVASAVNKRELAAAVAAKLPAALIEGGIHAITDHLTGELAQAGRLEYRDLGTFIVESYSARKIHRLHRATGPASQVQAGAPVDEASRTAVVRTVEEEKA